MNLAPEVTNTKDLYSWLVKHNIQYGDPRARSSGPKPISLSKDFLRMWRVSHSEMFMLMKNLSVTKEIESDKCDGSLSPFEVYELFLNDIISEDIYKKIFVANRVTVGAFLGPIVPASMSGNPLMEPFIGIKWNTYFKNALRKQKFEKAKVDEFFRHFEKINNAWGACKGLSEKAYVTISFDPRSFFQLSAYGCDNVSCLKPTFAWEKAKFNLATSYNTFVITINKERPNDIRQPNCLARCCGWTDENMEYWHLCNWYFQAKQKESSKLNMAMKVIGEIAGMSQPKIKSTSGSFIVPDDINLGMFFNAGYRATIYDADKSEEPSEKPALPWLNDYLLRVAKYAKCNGCGFLVPPDDYCLVDNKRMCSDCSSKFNTCELTLHKTAEKLVQYYNDSQRRTMNVRLSYVERSRLPRCEGSGVYFSKNNLEMFTTPSGTKYVSHQYLKKTGKCVLTCSNTGYGFIGMPIKKGDKPVCGEYLVDHLISKQK